MPLALNASLIHPGDRLCVAISGGSDSTALLLALHQQRHSLGIGLSAIHINHQLRPEAPADQLFVEQLCQKLDVPLSTVSVATDSHAKDDKLSTETAARNLRYAAFRTLLSSGEATAIATAHTLDDQAETVLLKLIRGAWLEGLSAIHPTLTLPDGRIIRPLLDTPKSEIQTFLAAEDQPWREDHSNTDPAFTRNRVRHELLPQLQTFNPSIVNTLNNLATLARDEESRWQAELDRLLPTILLPGEPTRGGGRTASSAVSLDLTRLKSMDSALRRRVLRAAAASLGHTLSFDDTHRLLHLCGFTTSTPGRNLHLPNGLRATRSPRELRLSTEPK